MQFYNNQVEKELFLEVCKTTSKIHLRPKKPKIPRCLQIVENFYCAPEDLKSFVKKINKLYGCGGTSVFDKATNQTVVQFQGDQRKNVRNMLETEYQISKE